MPPQPAAEQVVAMGEFAVACAPDAMLSCVGIGSCIALLLLDEREGVVGLGHVVVPAGGDGPPVKYATSAVPELVRAVTVAGGEPSRLTAVLVGGAEMFDFGSGEPIGARNERAVRDGLQRAEIPVVACDTGGRKGRTVRAKIGFGIEIRVRTTGSGESLLDIERNADRDSAGADLERAKLEPMTALEVMD